MPKRQPRWDNFVKFAVLALVILLGLFSLLRGLVLTLQRMDYFQVKEVLTNCQEKVDLHYLKGENIFALDLRRESGYILEQNPGYRSIRIVRIIPDRLFVDFIPRRPVAIVRLYRVFGVDWEGVFFNLTPEEEAAGLPLVTGLETKIFGPKPGQKYNNRELRLALSTLKFFKVGRVLRLYKVKRINASSLNDTSLFLEISPDAAAQWLEIKINESFRDKAVLLANILLESRQDLPNIKYIDLRFKDPLIKLKDKNAK
jgi:hypothetical protein